MRVDARPFDITNQQTVLLAFWYSSFQRLKIRIKNKKVIIPGDYIPNTHTKAKQKNSILETEIANTFGYDATLLMDLLNVTGMSNIIMNRCMGNGHAIDDRLDLWCEFPKSIVVSKSHLPVRLIDDVIRGFLILAKTSA
jgi:hypothetical protein